MTRRRNLVFATNILQEDLDIAMTYAKHYENRMDGGYAPNPHVIGGFTFSYGDKNVFIGKVKVTNEDVKNAIVRQVKQVIKIK